MQNADIFSIGHSSSSAHPHFEEKALPRSDLTPKQRKILRNLRTGLENGDREGELTGAWRLARRAYRIRSRGENTSSVIEEILLDMRMTCGRSGEEGEESAFEDRWSSTVEILRDRLEALARAESEKERQRKERLGGREEVFREIISRLFALGMTPAVVREMLACLRDKVVEVHEKGRLTGLLAERMETAVRMLERGLTISPISETTGVSEERLRELACGRE